MGPPQAVYLHRSAQGTRTELDGLPLWLVVLAEFAVRATIFTFSVFVAQEWIGVEDFHVYQLTFFAYVVAVSGAAHTLIYYLTLGVGAKRWSFSRMQRVYRLGRNLTYSVAPAVAASLATLWWQDLHHIPLFSGGTVEQVGVSVAAAFMVLGVGEALLVKRIPTGLELDASLFRSGR